MKKQVNKMRYLLFALIGTVLFSEIAVAQISRVKISKVSYSHALVGTVAAKAILDANIEREIKGWTICHDAGSASTYLSFSDGVDPDVDGTRLAAGQCYVCVGCSFATLASLNVKGQAASTGYSLTQEK